MKENNMKVINGNEGGNVSYEIMAKISKMKAAKKAHDSWRQ
jgi:hypothetical protein